MPRVSAAAALRSVRAGARVVATSYCATPDTLLRALAERTREVPGVTLGAGMLLGGHPYADAVRAGRLALRNWHVAGAGRKLMADGLAEYVPCRAGDLPALLARQGVDVALLRVSPPDARGFCSLGPSASYGRALVDTAQVVVAEVDEGLPRTCGEDVAVHVYEVDHLVETDSPTPVYRRAPVTRESARIADLVLGLLPEDATLQLGIGAVPEAVADALADAGAVRQRFVGLACDAMIEMVTGPRGASVTTVELMGGPKLFAACAGNPRVRMASSARVHDPRWLADLPRLVSVCSALQVDLTGQVASESVGGAPVAGIGGSADFFDGAHFSTGGLRVVALPATTAKNRSRIVARLDPGTPVTLPRHAVDVVVTEHGTAVLTGRSVRERAEALLGVVAPALRDEVASDWEKTCGPRRPARGSR
ncbi:acetyl-CoA hydrolase/transferase family protein [Pseudonocardia nigra]|uniref:acetyl-CoA hydrolase/transferase family protein n=1 Tax=Pseudonocardia nigra TaxID=1921578 RepID=UPI001C5FF2C1|nr:acetyl-CoA hydrolase/transferase C-terminal domain-containing protein [Pseudonocardia nigra]